MTQEEGLRPTEPATPEGAPRGPDDPLTPGTLVDRYEVLHAVGSGGMGVVYEARDTRLGRLVGLKLMRPHRDPDAAEVRLLREAQAMARISHPNVLTIYDVGTFQGRLYYAMELVEGGTLREWLKQRPRSIREIVEVFGQAARGLAAAHTAGLVHHDFKPENVLVSSDGRVRVADFGLVGLTPEHRSPSPAPDPLAAEEQPNAVIGTPGYMAPEQILGHPTDARADQFGFCVALCEALYGEGPFRAKIETDVETRVMVMAAVLSGSAHLPDGARRVPGWLRHIILRGLSLDPEARWPSLDTVARLLERGLRRRRRIGLLVAAGVLVASAASVAGFVPEKGKPMTEWRPEVIGIESEGNPARDGTSSKDGKLLAFSSRRAIWTQRRGNAERVPVRLPQGDYDLFTQRLSPGGERLFFVLSPLHEQTSELWRVDLPGGSPERIYAPPGVRPMYFDVAADGQTLALVEQDEAQRFRLRLIGPDHTGRTLVEPAAGEVLSSPAFSPDGTRIAFVRTSPSPTGRVEWLDLATGKLTRVGPARRYGVVEWSADDTLLVVVAGEDGGPHIREVVVGADGSIRRQRDVYRVPSDVDLWRVEATRAGVFIQRGPADGRVRVALLRLDTLELRVLPTGSEVDRHAAGWMPDGDIVLAARAAGHDAVVTGTLEKGFRVAGSFDDLGRPLWVMGDRVFYRRPGDSPDTFTLAVGGLAPPVTPLVQLSRSSQVYCAAGRDEPCLVVEPRGMETVAHEWDPRTGKRGREVLRWKGHPPGSAALSPDGKKLAFVDARRSVATLSLPGGERRELTPASAYTHHQLAWTPDGAILATRCCSPNQLVRIDADGKSTVVMDTGTKWLGDPIFSPDGKALAVSVSETEHTYLWVADPR